MLKIILLAQFFLFSILFASEKYVITNSNPDFLPVILFKSLENTSDIEKYPLSGQFDEIFMSSIKNQLKPLKNVNIVYKLNDKRTPDLIIKGDYSFYGNVKLPEIILNISILNSEEKNIIYEKKYNSFFDRRIFDTVDQVKEDIKNFCMELVIYSPPEIKEKKTGTIHFKNFNVGKEIYYLYINDNLLTKYVNKNFEKSIKLESEKNYLIRLIKESDEKMVFEKEIFLRENDTILIEYEGKANVTIEKIKNPEIWRSYKYFLDGEEILPEVVISNLNAGIHHRLLVKDNYGRTVYNDTFYLEDGETKNVKPYLTWSDTLSLKFYSVLSEYWAVGLDYNFFRYFWGGVNAGFNSFYNEENLPIYFFFTTIEAGYFYFVNYTYYLKMGVGFLGQLYFTSSTSDDYSNLPNDYKKAIKNGISLFLDFELFNFFIKPGVFYDFSDFYFQLSAGLRISL